MVNQKLEVDSTDLETTLYIAHYLVEQAVWHDNRCTFLGDNLCPHDSHLIVYQSFDGCLYDGSAGIARFLSYLYHLTQEKSFASTALGALEHGLTRSHGWSLYQGSLGAGLIAIEVASILKEPSLSNRGLKLIKTVVQEVTSANSPNASYDLISGFAGVIVASCMAIQLTKDFSLFEPIQQLAETLYENAHRRDNGWCWSLPLEQPEQVDALTGLAHGTTGIALAFAELNNLKPDFRWNEALYEAHRYECSWFSRQFSGWADLRAFPSTHGTHIPGSCPPHWCHGSVGIGLERLRIWSLRTEDITLAELGTALMIAATEIKRIINGPIGLGAPFGANMSLCHGLGGAIDLFSEASVILREASWLDLARQIADFGRQEFCARKVWRCGLQGMEETPGLMLGLAGIGFAYLRAHDPYSVPAATIFHADRFNLGKLDSQPD